MKILFAADGSKFTKKALAFLVAHDEFTAEGSEVVVLNCQPTMPRGCAPWWARGP